MNSFLQEILKNDLIFLYLSLEMLYKYSLQENTNHIFKLEISLDVYKILFYSYLIIIPPINFYNLNYLSQNLLSFNMLM